MTERAGEESYGARQRRELDDPRDGHWLHASLARETRRRGSVGEMG